MHLELDEQGGLVLVAPRHWSQAMIRKTVLQNSQRISRFMARAAEQTLAPLAYADGASHLYLGQQVTLQLQQTGWSDDGTAANGQSLNLTTSSVEPEAIKSALQQYYRRQAIRIFGERLSVIALRADWVGEADIPLTVRRMKRTWGNCSSSGKIKLNVHLIKAPLEIIDSVIAHELCHLKEMNHSQRFYALLQHLNPHWQQHRDTLRTNGFRYLHE